MSNDHPSNAPKFLAITALLVALIALGLSTFLYKSLGKANDSATSLVELQNRTEQDMKAQSEQIAALAERTTVLEGAISSYDEISDRVSAVRELLNDQDAQTKTVLKDIVKTLDRMEFRQLDEVAKLRTRVENLLVAGEAADNELKNILRELEKLNVKLKGTERELKDTRRDNFELNATRAGTLVDRAVWDDPRFVRCARAALRKSQIDAAAINLEVTTDATVERLVKLRFVGGESIDLKLGSPLATAMSACLDEAMARRSDLIWEREPKADDPKFQLVKRMDKGR